MEKDSKERSRRRRQLLNPLGDSPVPNRTQQRNATSAALSKCDSDHERPIDLFTGKFVELAS